MLDKRSPKWCPYQLQNYQAYAERFEKAKSLASLDLGA